MMVVYGEDFMGGCMDDEEMDAQMERCQSLHKMFGMIKCIEDDPAIWGAVMMKNMLDICLICEEADEAVEDMIRVLRIQYEKAKARQHGDR